MLFILIFGGVGGVHAEEQFYLKYKRMVDSSMYIRHALGGYDGRTYLNIVDAAEVGYKKGFRLYEVDVSFTSDKKLVLSHGWTRKDYKERLGLLFKEESPVPSHDGFMSEKMHGRYAPSDIDDLVGFMKNHHDVYVMIDIGRATYARTKKMYSALVSSVRDDSVLSRFIVGGHTTEAIRAVKEVYDFKLYNLYYAANVLREKKLERVEDFIRWCEKNGVTSVSISADRYSLKLAEAFNQSSLIVYVFTVDEEERARDILLMGASVVGTNFLE
ncbi:MAG: hypothetical protein FHK79_04460 [Pseudomonas sp.]|nr:MAG: hypothetical protein FHK79_04460 [Pseudomonas sp.]